MEGAESRSSPSGDPFAAPSDSLSTAADTAAAVFLFEHTEYGFDVPFRIRRVQTTDLPLIHAWLTRELAVCSGQLRQSAQQLDDRSAHACRRGELYLGYLGADPTFLLECYEPGITEIGRHYSVSPGDRGMRFLAAPSIAHVAGLNSAAFQAALEFVFSDPNAAQIVLEPDIRDAKSHALNRNAGFRYQRAIELSDRTAQLAFLSRQLFRKEVRSRNVDHDATGPAAGFAHLDPTAWATANRAFLAKAISEFAHEHALAPRTDEAHGELHSYSLLSDDRHVEYRFQARVQQLNHWVVQSHSLERFVSGQQAPLDAMTFFTEMKGQLSIPRDMLPLCLEEVAGSLYAQAYYVSNEQLTAADLVHADFQEIETALTAGHPGVVVHGGHIGLSAHDYFAYAPGTGASIPMLWLAARSTYTDIATTRGLAYVDLVRAELGADVFSRFVHVLNELGLNADDYHLIPVHPWQWHNKLIRTFAADIAERDLVYLGSAPDSYRVQQSIRTLFNSSQPHKHYIKTALSVFNLGSMGGLSNESIRTIPGINDAIDDLIRKDSFFAEHGFSILRDTCGVGYHNRRFEEAVLRQIPQRKMLTALFRESPVPKLQPGQRLMPLGALLHRDKAGFSLLPQLILASGVNIDTWLDYFLECYFAPLLHCFYRYDLAFKPSGENLILALDAYIPSHAFIKDVGEDAVILNRQCLLPAELESIRLAVPEQLKILCIFADVFDGFLRHMASILLEQAAYPESHFWRRVAACAWTYRRTHPEYRAKMDRYDLFAPEFPHSCLNRSRLGRNQPHINIAGPASAFQFAGTLKNPIAAFRHPTLWA